MAEPKPELKHAGDFRYISYKARPYVEGVWHNPVSDETKVVKIAPGHYDENSPNKIKEYTPEQLRTLFLGEPITMSYTTSRHVERTDESLMLCHSVNQYGRDTYSAQPEAKAMALMKADQIQANQAKIQAAQDAYSRIADQGPSFESPNFGT